MLSKKDHFKLPWVEGWSVRLREFNFTQVTEECFGHLLLCLLRIDALFWNSILLFSGSHARLFLLCALWEQPPDSSVFPWCGSYKSVSTGNSVGQRWKALVTAASPLLCHCADGGLGNRHLSEGGRSRFSLSLLVQTPADTHPPHLCVQSYISLFFSIWFFFSTRT